MNECAGEGKVWVMINTQVFLLCSGRLKVDSQAWSLYMFLLYLVGSPNGSSGLILFHSPKTSCTYRKMIDNSKLSAGVHPRSIDDGWMEYVYKQPAHPNRYSKSLSWFWFLPFVLFCFPFSLPLSPSLGVLLPPTRLLLPSKRMFS